MRILDNPMFREWPAAIRHHHAYDGGLLQHTVQVIESCEFFAGRVASYSPPGCELNWDVLFTAALWHDYGKLWDYRSDGADGWEAAPHVNMINHVARSYAEFMTAAQNIETELRDQIGHCILSHHGRKEWGSPVEPQTREAKALHLADMASAQVFEV